MRLPRTPRLPGNRRVLHPTDFSPASRPAFRAAVETAKAGGAPLLLVHVVTPVVRIPDVYTASMTTFDAFERSIHADARKRLDRLVAEARAAGVRADGLLLHGVPLDLILRAARSRRADVIVMGTHGRTGLAGAFLGSVAARVVALAPCPVLTVRARRQ